MNQECYRLLIIIWMSIAEEKYIVNPLKYLSYLVLAPRNMAIGILKRYNNIRGNQSKYK